MERLEEKSKAVVLNSAIPFEIMLSWSSKDTRSSAFDERRR